MAASKYLTVTVCEFPDEEARQADAWGFLRSYVSQCAPDLVVLPEMPFCEWMFVGEAVDPAGWQAAIQRHDSMISHLEELQCRWVVSSRPVERAGRRLNEAFAWSPEEGYKPIRSKWYLPDVPTARETFWFDRGDDGFPTISIGRARLGCQMCSEMVFPEHAREMGWAGAHLIVQPRATGNSIKWRAASQMCAVSSGCYVVSANRRSFGRGGFSGSSWLLSPDGDFLAETTKDLPVFTYMLDLTLADKAKSTYPRDLQKMYCSDFPTTTTTRRRIT